MSEQTKQAGKDTEYYLQSAEKNLQSAERASQGTKDPALIQKITKIKEAVTETKTDLNKKLDDNAGQKR